MKGNCYATLSRVPSMVSVVWKGEGDDTVKAHSPDRAQMPRPKGGIAHRLLTEAIQEHRQKPSLRRGLDVQKVSMESAKAEASIKRVRRARIPTLACPCHGHNRPASTCDHFLLHSSPSSLCMVPPCPGVICNSPALRCPSPSLWLRPCLSTCPRLRRVLTFVRVSGLNDNSVSSCSLRWAGAGPYQEHSWW